MRFDFSLARNGEMMKIPPILNDRSGLTEKKRRRRLLDLRRLSHELFNQLTLIHLSCFQIRGAVSAERACAVLAQIERIEKAAEEITDLLANLPAERDSNPGDCSTGQSPAGNVYPLFKSGPSRD